MATFLAAGSVSACIVTMLTGDGRLLIAAAVMALVGAIGAGLGWN